MIDLCTDDHVAIPQSVAIGRQIKPPQQGFELVKEWIRDCENNHPQCATRPANLPTRVIDVGVAGGQEPALKVASSRDTAYYMTLSHCWGRKTVIKTTKATLQSHLTQLPMGSLPKTFRDAITITRTLGVRYLWIDSLCIIQDDANDWEKESAVMGQIYAHSYLTIAASASKDSSGGCFLPRPRDTHARIKCSIDDGSTAHVFLRPKPKGFQDLENSFLQTRAWVAQERLLSPRSVHYDVDQIMWECKETRLTEDCVPVDVDIDQHQGLRWDGRFQLQYPRHVTKWSSLSIDFVWDWYSMIDNYTTRNLTNPDDKLPALSGIASVMAFRTGEKYVAGLWESHINIGMLWKRASTAPWLEAASGYRAPSWSWAAYDGAILTASDSYQNSSYNPFQPLLEAIQLEIKPLGLDPNGRLSFGAVTVTSRLKQVRARVDPSSELYQEYPENGAGHDHIWDGEESVGWVNYDEEYKPSSGPFFCLQMTHRVYPKRILCHCMVIEYARNGNDFRRVGLGCTGGGEVRAGWFDDAEKKRIRLI